MSEIVSDFYASIQRKINNKIKTIQKIHILVGHVGNTNSMTPLFNEKNFMKQFQFARHKNSKCEIKAFRLRFTNK